MPITFAPFATYAVAQVVSAAAQTEIIAQVTLLKNLLPDPTLTPPRQGATPDFDAFRPEQLVLLHAELDALSAAIEAAPII